MESRETRSAPPWILDAWLDPDEVHEAYAIVDREMGAWTAAWRMRTPSSLP